LEDKKAFDIKVLDVRGISPVTDYLIIASVDTYKQAQAATDEVIHKAGHPLHIDGYDNGEWIALDYTDCIVHVFNKSQREIYGLDQLWNKAAVVTV